MKSPPPKDINTAPSRRKKRPTLIQIITLINPPGVPQRPQLHQPSLIIIIILHRKRLLPHDPHRLRHDSVHAAIRPYTVAPLRPVGRKLTKRARPPVASGPPPVRRRLVAAPAVVVSPVCVAGAAAEGGEQADEEQAQGGHARAHDADVNFDGRPQRDRKVVPGRVGGLAEDDERVQADDGDDGDAGSKVSYL